MQVINSILGLLLLASACWAASAGATPETTGSTTVTWPDAALGLLAAFGALLPLNEARKAFFLSVARRIAHVIDELDKQGRLAAKGNAKLDAAVQEWGRRHLWAIFVPRGVMAYWLQFAVDSDPELGATAKPVSGPVVKAVIMGLVLTGSLLACTGTSCAEPPMGPADILDLGTLGRASTGRQNDAGVAWPAGFRIRRPVVVFVVEETASGDLYLMDPDELAQGRAGLHPWLVAVGRFGTITTRQATQRVIEAEVHERVRLAMQRTAIRLATQLPAALSGSAPSILRAVLQAVAGGQ